MPSSLASPEVLSTLDEATKPSTKSVKVGAEDITVATPFPSPEDWRDCPIYFLMLDRFNNPDKPPKNLPYDAPFGGFQGGTFNGVRAQLKYIRDLGARAIWISPPLKNRQSDNGTFHGYGIQDFLTPEPRFASAPGKGEAELRALVDEAHALGLYVIFDIVLNHTGDVFAYAKDQGSTAEFSPTPLDIQWRDAEGKPRVDWPKIEDIASPPLDGVVWPSELHRNEYFRRQGKGGEAGGDFESLKQLSQAVVQDGIFPVRNALIFAHQYLIAKYDVDGFRIDTLKYIGHDFAQVFGNATREFALSIGKKNFFTFGEVYDDEQKIAQFIGRNTNTDGDLIGVDASLDFPLFFRLPSVAKGMAPPTALVEVYHTRKVVERDVLTSHGDAGRYFVTFLDNHDQGNRFRFSTGDGPGPFDSQVTLGVGLLIALQGIPCLYYGTEQGLHGAGHGDQSVREALWGKKPKAFDRDSPFYKAIGELLSLRARCPALRYGRQYFRPISGDGIHFGVSPFKGGVVAFSRILNATEVVVVANTDTQQTFDGHVIVDAALNPIGSIYKVLNGSGASPPKPVAKTSGGIEIHEVDGSITSGPARTVRVSIKPMEIQILARA
ncbi:MAG: hypothetical protein JO284_13880 [Planctomycetaceae bacterium]|nr:hypothetical protein [Planctomycetaceae bacterium]MBV8229015.1 hypothetical protein [Planctomycetaceae bacterium]MBV8267547.1 hypothetical protein [Planctomycetaceae bacterium]MBV8318336.1 hypothetical protein [Planctomycetaceae bacterium]MBV8381407.1 hypothetical protein [Planctomycetaceae bacterium]